MTALRLWLGVAVSWTAAALTIALVPPHGRLDLQGLAITCAWGTAAGLVLFGLVARLAPRVRVRPSLAVVLVVTTGAEEIVWRSLLLRAAAGRAGPVLALVVTTGLFAAAHRNGRRCHLLTGACFGASYLLGGLIAAWSAHAAYDVAVAGATRRARTAA